MKAKQDLPFIIVRIYGTGADNDRYLQRLFRAQEKYPGLVNENTESAGYILPIQWKH